MNHDLVLIEAFFVGNGLARVLWVASVTESLGSVEGGREPYFADFVRVDLQKSKPSAMGLLTRLKLKVVARDHDKRTLKESHVCLHRGEQPERHHWLSC